MASHVSLVPTLRARRTALRLSREQLAVAAGISSSSVARMELGTHTPNLDTLGAVARVLGCTVADLLTDPEATEVA